MHAGVDYARARNTTSTTHNVVEAEVEVEVGLVYAKHAGHAGHARSWWWRRLEAYSEQMETPERREECFEVFVFRRSMHVHQAICLVGACSFIGGMLISVSQDRVFSFFAQRCLANGLLMLLLVWLRWRVNLMEDARLGQRITMVTLALFICAEALTASLTEALVSTDIWGRGIDIERVNIVVNYDMPDSSDTYLHRVGRAGRFGTKGLAITFASTDEDAKILEDVQSRFEVSITQLPETIDVTSYMTA